MTNREYALDKVRIYKKEIAPMFSEMKIYLFGSYSKGCAKADSDIDVAVIVPRLEGDWLDKSSALWLATLNVDATIEPVLIEECHPSPLYEEILRTGIVV